MKHIELKSVKQKDMPIKPEGTDDKLWNDAFTVNYAGLIKLALTDRPVSGYSELKQTGRILDALEASEKHLVLDDNDFVFLQSAVNELKFNRYAKEVEVFLEEVNTPKDGLPK